jgi:adenosylcobyric acid synthase
VRRLPCGSARGAPATGYEIHHGRVDVDGDEEFLGGARRDAVFGTMWHGSLEGDGFRRAFLGEVAAAAGSDWRPSSVSFPASREARLDLLGDLAEQHLDVDALLQVMRDSVSH